MNRCKWAQASAIEMHYHDTEWGVPVHDDRLLFEMLILESAQAGLSWHTILQKREGYKTAFDNFDAVKIANYAKPTLEHLLQNPAIVRHKLKIKAAIENAKCFLRIQAHYGSFDAYIWSFVNGQPIQNSWHCHKDIPSQSVESDAMTKSLKQHGFQFIGSTICYAYMQGVGMVNDHVTSCFRHSDILHLNQCVENSHDFNKSKKTAQ